MAAIRQRHEKDIDLTTVISHAIDECIQNNTLAEFLTKNRAEVMDILWYEYSEEEHIASEREVNFAEGETAGKMREKAEDILGLLENLGEVPQELQEIVSEQ